MAAPPRRADELSAGGLVVRRTISGLEVALIRVGTAWSLPKGNLDAGESPEDAALREVSEEIGLPRAALRILAPLPASEYAYRRHDSGRLVFKRVEHFLVELDDPHAPLVAQAAEVDEAAWMSLAEAERRVRYRDLRAALVVARSLLEVPTEGEVEGGA